MKVIKFHTIEGQRHGLLVSTGHKFHKVLLMDYPIRIAKVPLAEGRRFVEMEGYPLSRAKRHLRTAAGLWHGGLRNVSKEVREALR